MWRIGIILLIYGTTSGSLQCPDLCRCVETSLFFNNSHPELDIIDISSMDDFGITPDPSRTNFLHNKTKSEKSESGRRSDMKAVTSADVGGRMEEMFTYQITCYGLRDLKALWLQDLPDPTTQLIIQQTTFQSVKAFHQILKETYSKLSKLTDFSITNSIIRSQESKTGIKQDFLPFASILNPIPREEFIKNSDETDCSHLQILNLSNNTLTYLPQGLFHSCFNLQTLDLSNNLIKNLDDEIFHPLINLLRLDLHRNRLKSLNEAVFRNLTKLLTLDVSQNKISSVAPSTFQYLVSLNTLILSGNPLSTILVLLGTGKRLRIMDVSKTGLRQIPGTLERSVRTLILQGNLFTAIQCGDLDSYSLLSYLNLNNNKISYIADDAMGRLELLDNLQLSHNKLFQVPRSLPDNLEVLNLSFNLIQNITSTDFSNLSLLKELSLSNNQIRQIEENSFVNLLKLRTLDLSWNPILFLPPLQGLTKLRILNLSYFTNVSKDWRQAYKSFPTHSPGSIQVLSLESSPTLSQVFLQDTKTLQLYGNLSELYLRFSNLTTLRRDIFNLLPELKVLRLEGNPWHCDREMLYTSHWLRAHGANVTTNDENEINTMHCATPPRLHKKPLVALNYDDFQEIFPTSNVPSTESIFLKSFKNQSPFKRKQKIQSDDRIYLKSYEYSIESADNGVKKIEKASGAMKGYHDFQSSPVSPTPTDNGATINGLGSAFTNTPVTEIEEVDAFNLTTVAINSDIPLESVNVTESIANESSFTASEDSTTETFAELWELESSSSNVSFWEETSFSDSTNATNDTQSKSNSIDQIKIETDGGNVTADAETLSYMKQHNYTEHGFMVMIFIAVAMAASFAMALQHVTKVRRDQGYRLQSQEMEVHSISGATSDLW